MKIKRSLTLIELLAALALILIVGGVLSLPARSFLDAIRFEKEVKIIADKLNLASRLSVNLSTKTEVFIEKKNAHYLLYLSHDLEEDGDLLSKFFKRQQVLSSIKKITFNGETEPLYRFTFFADGKGFEKGLLELSSPSNRRRFIPFFPYFSLFEVKNNEPKTSEDQSVPLYPEPLLTPISMNFTFEPFQEALC